VNGSKESVSDQGVVFWKNGWRPVPADRHPGRYAPVGTKGNVLRGGMILMERPEALCDEARADPCAKFRRTGGDLRISVDPAFDVPAPQHSLAEAGAGE
jgi:hypothetical protein